MSTRIWTRVDYDKDGKQNGWLQLPHSVTRSAYGNIAIPITVIRNGSGPTAFLMAGNHGDEYEGQIALCRLIRELEAADIRGRIIALPAANLPAAMAGVRVSPIDDGNLNRAFPGDPDGTPTFAIAHYIDSVLYPMADVHHDLHSGGSSLQYLPFASMRTGADDALNRRARAALLAFGAPIGLVWAYARTSGCHRSRPSITGSWHWAASSAAADRSAEPESRSSSGAFATCSRTPGSSRLPARPATSTARRA